MNRHIIIAALIVAIATISGVRADEQAAAAEVRAQTKCPVMGGAINKKLYADVDGKRIYVCCKGCIGAIKKDPAKYIKKLEADGVVVEDVPAEKHGNGHHH
jgi:ssDNA-binding Zn-finger/Zn-ribbon topoisomerase 1